jgi:tyrosyl-tRNA synthetase
MKEEVLAGRNPRDFKVALGQEIVARFHSGVAAEKALEDFLSTSHVQSNQNADPEPVEMVQAINATVSEIDAESLLIDKYFHIVKSRQDLLNLSTEERAEIKRVFNSEFRFFSSLQKARDNVND